MIYKKSLLTLIVSSILLPASSYAQQSWVTDNTENAEGIVTLDEAKSSLPTVSLSKVIVSGVL